MWNASVREGFVPTIWESADVCPIGKITRPLDVDKDLRPISLTPIFHMRNWTMEIISDLIDPLQFRFLNGCSTTFAIIELCTDG